MDTFTFVGCEYEYVVDGVGLAGPLIEAFNAFSSALSSSLISLAKSALLPKLMT
jgi:hypothetical protein